jgi:hypothetical protein
MVALLTDPDTNRLTLNLLILTNRTSVFTGTLGHC